MTQTARDRMSSPVVVTPPETRVSQALTLMRRRGIHGLVVDLARGRPDYGTFFIAVEEAGWEPSE